MACYVTARVIAVTAKQLYGFATDTYCTGGSDHGFAWMIELKLTLLGGFGAQLPSGSNVDLPGQKDRALFAYLAIAPGDVHSRERLAGLLWSKSGDRQARDSLKQALLRLRRCLGSSGRALLRADRQSIALDRSAVDVDVLTFLRLARESTMSSLAEATTIYRGDLLDGIGIRAPAFEDWLLIERQRLRQLYERALGSLMSQALSADNHEQAGASARQLLALDSLNEAAYRALMQVHAQEGQSALALKLYEGLRDRLRDQLGVRPEPDTLALFDRIRNRRAATDRAPAALVEAELPVTEPSAPPATERPSVAVLPFVNLSNDPDQQYFSDGISEDIITELSRFQGLFVIARNSSFRFRAAGLDVIGIGADLSVRYIARGSVRRIGGRIRISAQLIDAQFGDQLWAENYDREASDILVVQDGIVRAIATTLGYRVEAASRERALRLGPEALSVHDLVLRSDAHLLRFTKDDNAESRRLAEKAVALDPGSAVAHMRLGWAYCMDHLFGWIADRQPALERAIALARRAVSLNERDSRARTLLGFALLYHREFEEARAQLRSAISLNLNDEEAHAIYGVLLSAVGEHDAAIEQFDIARRYDPFEFNWVTVCRGAALFTARRYDEAIESLLRLPHPNNEVRCWLAASYARAERLAEARAALEDFLAAAELELPDFPGRSLEGWKPYLRGFMEYRDPEDFDHFFGALQLAGLE